MGSRALISCSRWGGSGGMSRGGSAQGRRLLTLQQQKPFPKMLQGWLWWAPIALLVWTDPSRSQIRLHLSGWLWECSGAELTWAELTCAGSAALSHTSPELLTPERAPGFFGNQTPLPCAEESKFPHFQKFGASCCRGNQRELCTLLVLLAKGLWCTSSLGSVFLSRC